MESILTSIKKLIGITEKDEYFDVDIIMDINTAFSILAQLGVGPERGFYIVDKTSTWTDFIQDDPRLASVISYVHLKVKLLFDPPSNPALLESMNRQINELEWRLNKTAEDTKV